jgi:acylpyruvate hydrolase
VKVLCVGRNYAAHAREMGASAPKEPVWFLKPDSAIIADGDAIELPAGVGAVHHEAELAVRIGSPARRVDEAAARACIDAYTAANDVTARDLQEAAKRDGLPWTRSKGFDGFLPLGHWLPAEDLQALDVRLAVNGEVRQSASTREMTWSAAQLVSLASQWTTLHPGDILLTGTPQGVGPMRRGDVVAVQVGKAKVSNPVV